MTKTLPRLALASVFTGQLCLAEANHRADHSKSAPSNQPWKQYPQVNAEGRVLAESGKSNRRGFIYTSPDYDTDPVRRFPALDLQHRIGEDETGCDNQGHAHL